MHLWHPDAYREGCCMAWLQVCALIIGSWFFSLSFFCYAGGTGGVGVGGGWRGRGMCSCVMIACVLSQRQSTATEVIQPHSWDFYPQFLQNADTVLHHFAARSNAKHIKLKAKYIFLCYNVFITA